MTLKDLLKHKAALAQEEADVRASIEPALAALREKTEAINQQINGLLAADLATIRKLQEKEFGAVHITHDGYRVTETIPKRVKWDQDKLFGIYRTIRESGDDPFAWMKAEWKVGEKDYNAYPKEIQAVFAPARTVIPGEAKLEFKDLEVADA